jgi:ACT domain-containing protein
VVKRATLRKKEYGILLFVNDHEGSLLDLLNIVAEKAAGARVDMRNLLVT